MSQRKNCPRLVSKEKNKNNELATTIAGYEPHRAGVGSPAKKYSREEIPPRT